MRKLMLGMDGWYPQIDGVCLTVKNYYNLLWQRDWECSLIVPSYGKKHDTLAQTNTGIAATHSRGIAVPVGGYRCATPKTDGKIKKKIADFAPDILHSHSPFNIGEYFADYGKKHDVPSVITFHTKFKEEFMRVSKSKVITNALMKHILKVINKHDYVFTVCDGMVDVLRNYGYKGNVTVIRNGTDMSMPENADELIKRVNDEYRIADFENVILFVGRIVSVKNLQLMFNALKIAKQKSSMRFKFLVVGSGDDMNKHVKMVKDLDLTDDVIFVGEVVDRELLKGFYMRADLFAFPSTFDAFSLCPLEAAAFSLPSLLIKDSSTGETVVDGFSGFKEEENAEAWADKLIEIFGDKKKLSEIGENASKFVYRSWSDVVDEVESCYDAILSGKM